MRRCALTCCDLLCHDNEPHPTRGLGRRCLYVLVEGRLPIQLPTCISDIRPHPLVRWTPARLTWARAASWMCA